MVDYPCGKLVIVVSAVLVLSCRQTGTYTATKTHIQTNADEHYTPATLIDVSNYSRRDRIIY